MTTLTAASVMTAVTTALAATACTTSVTAVTWMATAGMVGALREGAVIVVASSDTTCADGLSPCTLWWGVVRPVARCGAGAVCPTRW